MLLTSLWIWPLVALLTVVSSKYGGNNARGKNVTPFLDLGQSWASFIFASDILGTSAGMLSGFVRRQFISLKMYFPYMHILVNTVLAEVFSPPVSHLHRKKKKTVNLWKSNY